MVSDIKKWRGISPHKLIFKLDFFLKGLQLQSEYLTGVEILILCLWFYPWQKEDMEKATLAFEPTFDGICQMFDTIVDIMITAVVETPRVEQGLFQVSLLWWIQDFPKGGSQPPDGRGGHQPII